MEFEFIIIGAGVAGATAFYHLSGIAPTLLLERKSKETQFDSVRIIVGHAQQYVPKEMPLTDTSIFIRPVNSIMDVSRTKEAKIEGMQEFGKPFGLIINEQNFIRWLINAGEQRGGKVVWGGTVSQIQINTSDVLIGDNQNQQYRGKLLLLSTGAYAEELNRAAGFDVPDQLNVLSSVFYASSEVLNRNFPADDFYLLHTQMSTRGPFQMTRGFNFTNAIYVSDESYDVMKEKYIRILKNYAWLQPILKDVQNPPSKLTDKDIHFGKTWKHPIKSFVSNRAIILGEATGVVTPCYFEGLLGCMASAQFAKQVLSDIYQQKKDYTIENLRIYETLIRDNLLKNFDLSQKGSEGMFLTPGQYQAVIWDAFLEAIKSDRKVRQNIWFAWTDPDIIHYPLANDEYCGERIYMSIPLGNRVMLTPFFLKLKFSSPLK